MSITFWDCALHYDSNCQSDKWLFLTGKEDLAMKTKSRRVTIPFIMLGLSAVSIASLPQANADDSEQCVDQRRVCLKPCIKTKEDKMEEEHNVKY